MKPTDRRGEDPTETPEDKIHRKFQTSLIPWTLLRDLYRFHKLTLGMKQGWQRLKRELRPENEHSIVEMEELHLELDDLEDEMDLANSHEQALREDIEDSLSIPRSLV